MKMRLNQIDTKPLENLVPGTFFSFGKKVPGTKFSDP